MAPLMFVTAFTGRASILRRPPDISSTIAFQSRKSSWKMSLFAQPDWIFQVIASARGATAAAEPPADAAGACDVAGAFDDRHDVTNAARPERDPYLRIPRRDTLSRRLTAIST